MTRAGKKLFFSALIAILLVVPASGKVAPPVRIAILVYDGVYDTEFIAPLDVFNHAATRSSGKLQVFTVSPRAGTVKTAEGLRVQADYTFANAPEVDWLIVPSGKNYKTDMQDKSLVGWIRRVGAKSKIVHSNCWGAFLLGAAGLLDGKEATTFPASLDEFTQAFPKVKVRRDLHLVDDGPAVTSAGGDVSYDAALYLVEKHFGADLANAIAGGLVIDWKSRRAGYQSAAVRAANLSAPRH